MLASFAAAVSPAEARPEIMKPLIAATIYTRNAIPASLALVRSVMGGLLGMEGSLGTPTSAASTRFPDLGLDSPLPRLRERGEGEGRSDPLEVPIRGQELTEAGASRPPARWPVD